VIPQPQRVTKSTKNKVDSFKFFFSFFLFQTKPQQACSASGTAEGSATCRTIPPVQSSPTIPVHSWDIYDISHSCHVNTTSKGGLKSSCQGTRTVLLCKIMPLTDTRHCICHFRRFAAAPLLRLGWSFGRGVRQGKNINETVKMPSFFFKKKGKLEFVGVSGGYFPSGRICCA